MIVIGLGSGRCGTASLAALLDSQNGARCFHEANAVAVRFSKTPRPCLNTVEEFQAVLAGGDPAMVTADLSRPSVAATYDRLVRSTSLRVLGDVGYYYLNYVETIAARHANIRFVCMQRDRSETIRSWLDKTELYHSRSHRFGDRLASLIRREPFTVSCNHWMAHDGTKWRRDPVWDKTFPKFDALSKEEAIGMYWDYYYAQAELLATRLPAHFRIFDIETLNSQAGQEKLLTFCGMPSLSHVYAGSRRNVQKASRRAA